MSTFAPPDETQTDGLSAARLDDLVRRAKSLYTLPAVAAKVIELTSNPKVDVPALKDCIEVDPALTAKILRVVNSSLFGLSREVSDLNQAIALLGTKPLKLLVLGFSLPDQLFRDVAEEQLEWYWTKTLARAVAAREISEQLWDRPGDDAFLAGLLQDIGVLVLLGEIKQPYAQFLDHMIQEQVDLRQTSLKSLGFDHTSLSYALLEHWKMPKLLVQAIVEPRQYRRLMQIQSPAAELSRILHLADLLADLVALRRLDVLADVLELGEAYCELNRDRLNEVVFTLESKVSQLAEVLSLDLGESTDYAAVICEAHQQMALITEGLAEPLSRTHASPESLDNEMLANAMQVREAIDEYRQTSAMEEESDLAAEDTLQTESANSTLEPPEAPVFKDPIKVALPTPFVKKLTLAVGRCRSLRQPLSAVLLEVGGGDSDDSGFEQALNVACRAVDCDEMEVESMTPFRRVLLLPNCERQEAVRHAAAACRAVEKAIERHAAVDSTRGHVVSAGVATVTLAVRNFQPVDLLETAERCLAAARLSGSCVVKSLEIY